MSKSPSAFDAALHLLPAPVTVVGVKQGKKLGGLTAAWVTRVSLDPPLLMVAIGHERHTWGLLFDGTDSAPETNEFTISVLHENQVETARLFGLQSGRDKDKWSQIEHDLLGKGVPAVADCAAQYLCRMVNRFTAGDHDCVVGEIISAESVAGGPALPMRGMEIGRAHV